MRYPPRLPGDNELWVQFSALIRNTIEGEVKGAIASRNPQRRAIVEQYDTWKRSPFDAVRIAPGKLVEVDKAAIEGYQKEVESKLIQGLDPMPPRLARLWEEAGIEAATGARQLLTELTNDLRRDSARWGRNAGNHVRDLQALTDAAAHRLETLCKMKAGHALQRALSEDGAGRRRKSGSPVLFVSYSCKDRDHAMLIRVRDELKRKVRPPIEVFLAEDTTEFGRDFVAKVLGRLERAVVVIPFITENSRGSPWVNQEIGYAKGAGIPVFAVFDPSLEALPGMLIRDEGCPFDDANRLEKLLDEAARIAAPR